MARTRSSAGNRQQANDQPLLLVPRDQISEELHQRINLGNQILDGSISTQTELEAARSDYYSWDEYNRELLSRRFSTTAFADEYSYVGAFVVGGYDSLAEKVHDLHDDVSKSIRRLESLRNRLELIDEAESVRRQTTTPDEVRKVKTGVPESIFLVHGHDGEAKLAVHGFLREVTTVPAVILHDEANRGRTLIEKFEQVGHASGFAIAILTADDEGRAKGESDLRRRGRQNVVFEFGFFVGFLGRAHTAVLYEEGVDLPSDLDGLVYIPYDARGAWKMLLAKELNAAGIAVDLNRAL
jgi:predicted nucleotide-binding protein